MPLKIKELRKQPDPVHYVSFLEAISSFYQTNGELELHAEFWSAELNETQVINIFDNRALYVLLE